MRVQVYKYIRIQVICIHVCVYVCVGKWLLPVISLVATASLSIAGAQVLHKNTHTNRAHTHTHTHKEHTHTHTHTTTHTHTHTNVHTYPRYNYIISM